MRSYCMILIAMFACSSPLRAAACKTYQHTHSLQDCKENLMYISSMINTLNCLSQDEDAVQDCEHLLLSFLQEIQRFAIFENSEIPYKLWAKGVLNSYYDVESVKIAPDTYVVQVVPTDRGKINFHPFYCNLYMKTDLMALLGGNPAVLFVDDFLKEYQKCKPSSCSTIQHHIENIEGTHDNVKKQFHLNCMLRDCVKYLMIKTENEDSIINERVLSYFIDIVMTDESYCVVRPKRPACLNFQEFSLSVDIELAYLLHSYGLWISEKESL